MLPLWRVYYERGRSKQADGRTAEAVSDFRHALDLVRRLRLEALPADSVWINTNVDYSSVCAALIRAASALYLQTGKRSHALLAFEASEESRAAGLRALIYSPSDWRRRLAPQYWETLAQVRAAESDLLVKDTPAVRAELSALHYKLTEMEAEAGLDLPLADTARAAAGAPGLLGRIRQSLGSDDAFLSFHLDEPVSFRWVVTRESFGMHRLAARGRNRDPGQAVPARSPTGASRGHRPRRAASLRTSELLAGRCAAQTALGAGPGRRLVRVALCGAGGRPSSGEAGVFGRTSRGASGAFRAST